MSLPSQSAPRPDPEPKEAWRFEGSVKHAPAFARLNALWGLLLGFFCPAPFNRRCIADTIVAATAVVRGGPQWPGRVRDR